MRRVKGLPFVGLSELLVLTGVLVMLGAVLAPVWPRTEEDNIKECLTRVRQMAIATQMYDQDNNARFPGADWVKEIAVYLGNNQDIFHCPDVPANAGGLPVSYGYNGLLLRCDGNGVNESVITAPTEVGVVCDAEPARAFPNGGIIGGGGMLDYARAAVQPCARHNKGIVFGYADGHAKYWPQQPDVHDAANPITRAFYTASSLGLIQNPGAADDFAMPGDGVPTTIALGGDFASEPILIAAAEAWKKKAGAAYFTRGFLGQDVITGRNEDYVWGFADGDKPQGNAYPIARDALVFIVSKNTKITIPSLHAENGMAELDDATLHGLCEAGYCPRALSIYSYNHNNGNLLFLVKHYEQAGDPLVIGKQAIIATDDQDMVNKVACDPYGIGYCSAAMADPERVTVVDLVQRDGTVARFANNDPAHRWQYPAAPHWPLMRTLYAVCNGKAAATQQGNSFADVMLAPGAAGTRALQAGPLFVAGYYKP